MLRFEMDVAATDLAERTIEGRMVPYGEVGMIRRQASIGSVRARSGLRAHAHTAAG